MKKISRRQALAALSAVAYPGAAAAQALRPLIVGAVVNEDSVPIWYAASTGMFRRAGLDVDVRRAAGGFAAPLAVLGGTYNIVNSNLLSVTIAHTRAVPLTIVAYSGFYNGTPEYNAVIVLKDSSFQTAADLNGHVFGTAGVNDLASLAMHSWMDRHGGDFSSLKVVEVAYPTVLQTLETGRIDAGHTLQPFLSAALASGKVRLFADPYSAIAPRFAGVGWIATTAWADANADTVRRFARVVRDAQVYCNAHRSETAPILAQNTGADLNTILRGGRETYAQSFADPKQIQQLIDAAAKYGAIDHRFDAGEIIAPAVKSMR